MNYSNKQLVKALHTILERGSITIQEVTNYMRQAGFEPLPKNLQRVLRQAGGAARKRKMHYGCWEWYLKEPTPPPSYELLVSLAQGREVRSEQ